MKCFLFTYIRIENGLPGEEQCRWFKSEGYNPEIKIKEFLGTFGNYEYDNFDTSKYNYSSFSIKITSTNEFKSANDVARWIARRTYINGNLKKNMSFHGRDDNGNQVRCIAGAAYLHLNNQSKPIYLGKLTEDGDFIRGDRAPLTDNHKMVNQFRGWAVNAIVLREMPGEHVIIKTDKGTYRANKQRILNEKLMVTQYKAGYEEQYGIRENICEKVSSAST